MSIIDDISLYGLLPVIKIEDAADAVPLVGALKDGGLPVAEITFRTEAAAKSIELATKAFPDALIGAGTVLSVDQLKKAVDAGAKYIVSPGFNPKVVGYASEHGIPMVPGVATPGDIEAALEYSNHILHLNKDMDFFGTTEEYKKTELCEHYLCHIPDHLHHDDDCEICKERSHV